MEIRKPRRVSLSAQLVEEMERLIAAGEWPVGSRILPEPELVKLFGVSRNTVREALQALIHAGLLAARPGDGTYVQRRTRMESVLHNEFAEADTGKLLEARVILELGIAELAAKNRTAEDLTALRKALDKRNQVEAHNKLDAEFHAEVAKATHNFLLAGFYNEICRYMLQNLPETLFTGEKFEDEIALHEALFRALSDGNPDAAKNISRTIIEMYAANLGIVPQSITA